MHVILKLSPPECASVMALFRFNFNNKLKMLLWIGLLVMHLFNLVDIMEGDNTPPVGEGDILDIDTGAQRHFLITEISGLTALTEASIHTKGGLEGDTGTPDEAVGRDGAGCMDAVKEGGNRVVVSGATDEGRATVNEFNTEDNTGTTTQYNHAEGEENTRETEKLPEELSQPQDANDNITTQENKTVQTASVTNADVPHTVTLVSPQPTPPPPTKPRNKLAVELEKLQMEEDAKEEIAKSRYRRQVRKTKRAMDKAQAAKGIELYPDTNKTKAAIQKVQTDEEKFALSKNRVKLDAETNKLKHEIDDKFGILLREKRPDITSLAENLFSKTRGDPEIPSHVTRVLTRQEIEDLRLVFGMFDVKGKG